MTAPTAQHPSVGDFYRSGVFQERRRYVGATMQRSRKGSPRYIMPTDFYDWSRIVEANISRLMQIFRRGVVGEDAFKLGENVGAAGVANNFLLGGGSGTAETAETALLGGYRAALFEDVDYRCLNTGVFSTLAADQIHHQYTIAAGAVLTDEHASWTINALAGLSVVVELVAYPIISNTATALTLGGGFNAAALTGVTAQERYYYLQLDRIVGAATDQEVYLDIHLEDWGAAEDPQLNHNVGGTTVESLRRRKVVQWVNVEQVVGMFPTVDYVDLLGTQHYVLKLGTINRRAVVDIAEADITNDREEFGGSPVELVEARDYLLSCVTTQPTNLKDRLQQEESWITVGDGASSDGMFNGIAGLVAAMACGKRTIFVKNGTYDFSGGGGQLEVPVGVRLIAESPDAELVLDETQASWAMRVQDDARVEGFTVSRSDPANTSVMVEILGANTTLWNCFIEDVGAAAAGPAIRIYEGGALVGQCFVAKKCGKAVEFGSSTVGWRSRRSVSTAWGATLRDCRVVVEAANIGAALDNDFAAIDIYSGVQALVDNCTVITDGQALRVRGQYAVTAGIMSTQGGSEVRGSSFLMCKLATMGGCPFVHLQGAVAKFHNNVVDAFGSHTTAHFSYGIYCDTQTSGYVGNLEVHDNLIRGAETGIHVNYPGGALREVSIRGNTILPDDGLGGMEYGINIYSTVADNRGRLQVVDNYVVADSDTTSAIRLYGSATVRGNILDGAGVTNVSGKGIQLLGAGEVNVSYNFLNLFPRAGILLGSSALTGIVSGNVVYAKATSDYGIEADLSPVGAFGFVNNHVDGGLVGIRGKLSNNPLFSFNGNRVSNAAAYGMQDCGYSQDNVIDEVPAVGIYVLGDGVSDQCVQMSGNTSRSGVVVNAVRTVEINDCDLHRNISTALFIQAAGRASVRGNYITVDKDPKPDAGFAVYLHQCGELDVEGNTVLALDSVGRVGIHGGTGIYVTPTSGVVPGGHVTVQNNIVRYTTYPSSTSTSDFGPGILVDRVGDAGITVAHNTVDAGTSGVAGAYYPNTRSILVRGSSADFTVSHNKAKYGIHAENTVGGVVSNNNCAVMGIVALMPDARVCCNDVSIGVPTGYGPDAAGVWIGDTAPQPITAAAAEANLTLYGGAEVLDNSIYGAPAGSPTHPASLVAAGGVQPFADRVNRTAAIVVRADKVTVKGNVVRSDATRRLALLIGYLDYVVADIIGTDSSKRIGVAGAVTIQGNNFHGEMQVAVVLASRGRKRGGGFCNLVANVWSNSRADAINVMVFHDFNQGTLVADQCDVCIMGNSLYYLGSAAGALSGDQAGWILLGYGSSLAAAVVIHDTLGGLETIDATKLT